MTKIAIIGTSALFPGSSTPEGFWDNLMQEKDLTGLATEEDFGQDPQLFYKPNKGVIDSTYSLRGGYIRDFEFDPKGYNLSEDFLRKQDKLYQWSLYVAKEALKDSGYWDSEKARKACGLILGNLSFPTSSSHQLLSEVYTDTMEAAAKELLNNPDFKIPNSIQDLPDNDILTYTPSEMVNEALGLSGNHYALDAACATSLYAIKLACDELITGKADMMLAGAVCASDQLFIHVGFSIFHAYAPTDQKFVPLDSNSAGLVSSEGAGMVVLKRLEDAERDGDKILGVIGAIGLSNDGRGKFLLSPNPKGQKLAFQRAYEAGNISPKDTTYLECHATGTPLGDVTELNSIADFFEIHGAKPLLGSVKSNMGHLLTAAGMTGLLKVLLAMQKNAIPPNINLQDPVKADNGWIGGEQMIKKTTPWADVQKQAGINSFGFGGTNAHMVVQNYLGNEAPAKSDPTMPLQDMAIIGMDAHFGTCDSLTKFHQTIYKGSQHFEDLPKSRWKGFDENSALLKRYGFEDGKAPKGAYIEDFEIDLFRYKIQPKEAVTLEPQQALILKVADNAIKDAGLTESSNVAVLIAMESELAIHHYLARWDVAWQVKEALKQSDIVLDAEQEAALEKLCKNGVYYSEDSQTPSQYTSFVGNIMASRIAALWDFNGAAFTVSCGENSVFKAMEIAQNMLSLGECDAVVVGGVDFSGGLENVLLRNQDQPVNSSSKPSLSHNKNDHGWLIGEGAGAVVLKKKADVVGDKTYALINGVGKAKALPKGGYLELAATGFEAQDELERQHLQYNASPEWVALGSVKANIGHTFAASGIAGLIKTSLCLYHRFIPGIPNWEEAKNAEIFEQSNYYFPDKSRPWVLQNGVNKRQAAVNGLDGLQIQLSEAVKTKQKDYNFLQSQLPSIFSLKGNSEKDLQHQLSALEIALETNTPLHDIAEQFHKIAHEKQGDFCIVLITQSKEEINTEINFFKNNIGRSLENKQDLKTPKGSYFTPNPLGKKGKVAFVYPGSSTAYTGLGQDLYQLFPTLQEYFEDTLSDVDEFIASDYLYPKTKTKSDEIPNIYNNAIAMMSVGVFYSANYTRLLRNVFKLEPDMALGYSMGECSSMWYSTDVWSPHETKEFQESPIFKNRFAGNLELLAETWGISSEEAKARWISIVLLAPKSKVLPLVKAADKVYLTFINTENEVVISGDKAACEAIVAKLACQTLVIPFQNVIHHDFCQKEESGLIKMHNFELQEKPSIDYYSSISGKKIPLDSMTIAKNSTAVCSQLVDFPKTVSTAYNDGARIFIEVGANATCTGWVKSILTGKEHLAVSINQKGKSDLQSIIGLLSSLLSHGIELKLETLYPSELQIKKGAKFAQKIIPGGTRIFDSILADANKTLFKDIRTLTDSIGASTLPPAPKGEHQPAQQTESLDYLSKSQNRKQQDGKKKLAIASSNTFVNLNKFSITNSTVDRKSPSKTQTPQKTLTTTKKIISNMDTTITKKVQLPTAPIKRMGENGLRLQDFASGEQLEGKNVVFTQEDLVEFANGSIAKVFGQEYSVIDGYRRRVMLPMDPYLLVSRVTDLNATRGEYKPSTMQTEYDIPYGAWYSTDGQIPWAVSVESGQCDLLLISYLGIDFENKGDLVYRLLDCTLTFVDDLPCEGQTLRYDISINSFVNNGDNMLFFFSYRCYVEDRLVLKMDGGCAGFFRDDQLTDGKGVVYSEDEIKARQTAERKYFTPILNTKKTSFSKEDLRHLINGDMEKCFGDISYYANGRNPSLRLPPEKILMIDRINSVDLTGGAYGLGMIVAEKDLHPDDWYFPCHFRDDEVLAGSLQAEGGGNLLRFFMLMLGLQRRMKDARYQPVFDLPQKVRCRKQVTPTADTKLIYKLEIKEIGLIPDPYVVGDLEIISDGVITVHFENLGLQLREKDNPKYLDTVGGVKISPRSEGALMNEMDITTFALGDLKACFGPDYAVFDGRTSSRQPNGDLQLISRILKVDGERGNFSTTPIYAEYDVPMDAWYYEQNSNVTMPYSIIMEIALQPCGLLGAYLGSTLLFPEKDLYLRNLDGEGEYFDLPNGTDFRGKVIENKSVLVSSIAHGGTILQRYTFELSIDGYIFYKGNSSFGFFTKEALADQGGLDKGQCIPAWYKSEGLQQSDYMSIKLDSLYGKMKLYTAPASKPHYRLAEDQLNMLHELKIVKNGGKHGLGYIHATKYVKTYDWYFVNHFYQDPVMPGSLGVESIFQAMQVFALQQDLGKDFKSPKFTQLANHKQVWKYRGQILLGVDEMHLEVQIRSIEKQDGVLRIIGDAFLWSGDMRIYQVTGLGLGIEEG